MNSLRGAAQTQDNKAVVELEHTEEKKEKKNKTSAVNQQASAISPLEKIKKKLTSKPKKEKVDTKASEAASTIKPKSNDSQKIYSSEEEILNLQKQIFMQRYKSGELNDSIKMFEKYNNLTYSDKQ